jgi:hypothetical protein
MDSVWGDRQQARTWGEAGRRHYAGMAISWPTVVERLLA